MVESYRRMEELLGLCACTGVREQNGQGYLCFFELEHLDKEPVNKAPIDIKRRRILGESFWLLGCALCLYRGGRSPLGR